jgi:uncharacterized protein
MTTCPGPTATSFFEGTSTHMVAKDMDSSESVVRRTLDAFDHERAVAYPGRMSVKVGILVAKAPPSRPHRTHRGNRKR